MNGIKANSRIRVEQDVDLVLNNMKLKILGQPHDEALFTTDSRYKDYKANEDRIILKNGLLSREFFGESGSVKHYQILIPKQLVTEVLRSLRGEFGTLPGNTETIAVYRRKYYFPNLAQLIRERVMSCKQCVREFQIDRSVTRPPLLNPNEDKTAPEDAMKNDLVPELPPTVGYEKYCDTYGRLFSLFFASPTSN